MNGKELCLVGLDLCDGSVYSLCVVPRDHFLKAPGLGTRVPLGVESPLMGNIRP